ncbi:MAG: calcium-binding protein [Caldimonas sp.]
MPWFISSPPGGGVDVVRSPVTWTLGDDLENLSLTGTKAVSATGNALANVLFGNIAANVIRGEAGADRLDGGAANDTLVGGLGDDTYLLGRGYGSDRVQEDDAAAGNTDTLSFLSGIGSEQIWFRHVGNDLQVSVIGTGDKAALQDWYLGPQHRIEQFRTDDRQSLLDSRVQELVTAMASFTPPALGQTTLSAGYSALLPVIAATWQPAPTSSGLRMTPDVDPTTDVALHAQAAGLIDAMAAFSASSDARLDVLPIHSFHALPVAVNPLAA